MVVGATLQASDRAHLRKHHAHVGQWRRRAQLVHYHQQVRLAGLSSISSELEQRVGQLVVPTCTCTPPLSGLFQKSFTTVGNINNSQFGFKKTKIVAK